MSKKDENKSRKRLTLSLGLVASLGILSIAYAIVSSQLNIKSGESKLVGKYQGAVQFVGDGSCDYSIGTTDSSNSVYKKGPFYSTDSGKTTDVCNLKSESSPSYVFAKAGEVAITTGDNTNDTATINGTELFAKGSYVTYKLQIKNTSNLPMRLSAYDANALKNSIKSATTGVKDIVDVKIYSQDPGNSENGTEIRTLDAAAEVISSTPNSSNFLHPDATTDWYVRVYCKEDAENFVAGAFSFEVKPAWSPIQLKS